MATGTNFTNASYSAFVKKRFPQKEIENLVAFEKPFFSTLTHKDELDGNGTYIPVETDLPTGYGAQYGGTSGLVTTTSSGRITGSRGFAWQIQPAYGVGMLKIDGVTMLAMRKDEGAFFRAREREIKNMLEALGQNLEMLCWKAGNPSLGTVVTDPVTAAAVVMSPGSALNFHEGDEINWYADTSGIPDYSTVRAGGADIVLQVDYDTDTVTFTAALDTAIAAGDHAVRATDALYVTGASGAQQQFCGVPSWILSTSTVSSTSFFGVDRSLQSRQKVAGHKQGWLGSIEETVKKLDSNIRRLNQRSMVLWLSYANFNRLDLELGARGYRMEGEAGKFGRPSLMMSSPGGSITVKAGPYVPEGYGYLLAPDTWALYTLGKVPHIVEDDGNVALRVQNLGAAGAIEDAIEIRFRWLAQLVCTKPMANGVFVIS
jgi:hypothetical protein